MARPFCLAARMAVLAALAAGLAGCAQPMYATLSDRECMARVMYFESNRSSEDGMLAVGTVVMNRLQSPKYPKSVCGVVGQDSQFAPGALTKPVSGSSWTRALRVADRVIAGERHENVGGAMFFHTSGYSFPYRNMAYVVAAGGNVFYEKRTPGTFTPYPASAFTEANPTGPRGRTIQVASRDDDEEAPRLRRPARLEPEPEVRKREPVRLASADDDFPAPRRSTLDPDRRREPIRIASRGDDDEPPAAAPTRRPTREVERRREPARAAAKREEDDDDERPAPRRASAAREAAPPTRREPLQIANAGPRPRHDGPPTIAELIELDMGSGRRPSR